MWLPKDERRLLEGYYVNIGEVSKQHEFPLDDLLGFIKSNASGHLPPASDSQQYVEEFKAWLKDRNKVIIANKALEKRGLITSPNLELEPSAPITISLSITGYDLGRKYNSWWSRSGLWFAEYKDHWFWLIVGFLGGIIGALIVNWLSNVQGAK
jgi:hypothetical protein